MASAAVIGAHLAALRTHYRDNRSDDEMAILTTLWAQDMQALNDGQFVAAVREARMTNRFFPTSADVLKAHDRLQDAQRGDPTRRALPEKAGMTWEEARVISARHLPRFRRFTRRLDEGMNVAPGRGRKA